MRLSGYSITSAPFIGHIGLFRLESTQELVTINISVKLQLQSMYDRKLDKLQVVGNLKTGGKKI